jgi:molecular chaperone DnaK (HSP70)
MPNQQPLTLFALDCGATNWRLYRSEYEAGEGAARLVSDPQPSPLTSFVDRRLPAVICLDPKGEVLESFGEVAQQQLEDELTRERVREYFKPCIGSHLAVNPLPHQKRYTHERALAYTRMLLQAVLDQARQEKWRSAAFDDRVCFTIAYPIHWKYDHEGVVFGEFAKCVRECFDPGFDQIRFVAEPEGAILSLQHRGQLDPQKTGKVTWIVDIGGSTTDIVAGRTDPLTGRLEYLGHYGEPFGGGLYDAELAKRIADDLNIPASALADDPSAIISLRVSAQRLKESLSRQLVDSEKIHHVPQRTVTLVMRDGSIFRRVVTLDEARFREITAPLDNQFKNLIENALAATGIREADIGQVVLVGGGSQLFTILGHLRQRFGAGNVLLADNPEEIVVQGIGLELGAASRETVPATVIPVDEPAPQPAPEAAAPTEQGWILKSVDGAFHPLPAGITKIGRGEGNDLQIDALKVSRFHAELRLTTGVLEVVDLGSTNGTFVNGERLAPQQPRALNPGDEVCFGAAKFTCAK